MVPYLRLVFALPFIAVAALAAAFGIGGESPNAETPIATTTTRPLIATTTTTSTTVAPTTTTTTLPIHLDPVATEIARATHGQCGEFYELAVALGWPAEEWPTLSRIMWRESKCQPSAWSGSDAGLLQINRIHTEWAGMMGWSWPDDLFIAENNLLFACRLWSTSGWGPWRFSGDVPSTSINRENAQCSK